MASSLGRKEAAVPNSPPAAKRQKTSNNNFPSGTSAANTYNSDADSGDDLFDGFNPTIPDTPAALSHYETQPTQILDRTAHNLSIASHRSLTPSKNEVQVPASSPLAGKDTESTGFTPKYLQSPPPPSHNGAAQRRPLAMSMAPAGTAYKPPNGIVYISDDEDKEEVVFKSHNPLRPGFTSGASHLPTMEWKRSFEPQYSSKPTGLKQPAPNSAYQTSMSQKTTDQQRVAPMTGSQSYALQKPPAKAFNLHEEDVQVIGSDSSEDELAHADIRPSTFKPRSTKSSFNNSPPSQSVNGNSTFQNIVSSAKYNPSPDSMSLGYGSVRKPMQKPLQRKPERAAPVGEDLKLDDLSDANLRHSITRLRQVFPEASVLTCRNVLIRCKGSVGDAAVLLGNGQPSDDVESPQRPVQQSFAPRMMEKPLPPQMKRVLVGPTTSVAERYSSTQAAQKSTAPLTPQPKKKKLMQGRRNGSSPAVPDVYSPRVATPKILEDSDSGVASEDPAIEPEVEIKLLNFLNICSAEALVDLTSTTLHNAEVMIAARPFKKLAHATAVEDSAKTKGGKRSKRAPVGEKIVEVGLSMYMGYGAIDALVKKCGELGKPLFEEMKTWGFDTFGTAKGGELDLTSFDDQHASQRDSGIGSPASADDADDDVKGISTRKKGANFIKQPATMAEDFVLKDYQVVGLNWLAMMCRRKLSGILADEMGLGKTAQVIALITHLVETGRPGPHLVICPGSTLENWCKEIQRFSPDLTIGVYRGIFKQSLEWGFTINLFRRLYASKRRDGREHSDGPQRSQCHHHYLRDGNQTARQ